LQFNLASCRTNATPSFFSQEGTEGGRSRDQISTAAELAKSAYAWLQRDKQAKRGKEGGTGKGGSGPGIAGGNHEVMEMD